MKRLSDLASRLLEIRSTWVVVIITFVWLAATTWTRPLLLPDEGRYVGVAWNMVHAGQMWVPRLDGLPFFHKPPLFYWITGLSLQLFGVNEWAARLSSVLSATLMTGLLFWFLKTYANRRLAILAVIILAFQPLFFGGGQYANLDMTVAGMITATVIVAATAVFEFERGRSYRWLLVLAYALAGLGFLAKGLIGIVLPGGILFFWLLGRRRFDCLLRLIYLPGIAVFLLVSLPWMIYMQWLYPGFFDYYIVYQQFQRFLEKGFNNPYPFWFYVPVLLVLTLPWSWQLWRLATKTYWTEPRDAAIRGLMLSWFLVVLIFFSLPASKLVGYILPALAPLAYFLAEPFAARLQSANASRALGTWTWYLVASIVICLGAVLALVVAPQPSSKVVAEKMLENYRPEDTVVMLDQYRYDLGFYLKTAKSSVVASDWDSPRLKLSDNWRKELFDAGQFAPQDAALLLISSQQLVSRLCSKRVINLWLVGNKNSVDSFAFLKDMTPYARDGKLRVWYIKSGLMPSFCAEMPKPGPK